jgi:hypothetical protein
VREQRGVLESHRHLPELRRHQHLAERGNALRVQMHLAVGGRVEAGDQPQQRGLAAARRAEDRDHLARGHVEGHVRQHVPAGDRSRQ